MIWSRWSRIVKFHNANWKQTIERSIAGSLPKIIYQLHQLNSNPDPIKRHKLTKSTKSAKPYDKSGNPTNQN